MSENVKEKKSKIVAKKKTESVGKKKTTAAKKKTKISAVKSAQRSKVSQEFGEEIKSTKKKTSNNAANKVKSKMPPVHSDEYLDQGVTVIDSEFQLEEDLSVKEHMNELGRGNALADNVLSVKLSKSLFKKLQKQATDEGVSLEDFVSELLAESVVLRAWEIVERKSQMRTSPNQNVNNMSGNSHGGQSGNSRNRKGRMSHGRYQSIMDDKATFLEYVRNQERSRR